MKITVLGLGNMGLPMAERLCKAGCSVSVWNRTPGKADHLAALGAAAHTHAASAVKDADIVVSMLESGPVVEDVFFNQGVAAAIKPGALVIDMASIKPREARDHAARIRPHQGAPNPESPRGQVHPHRRIRGIFRGTASSPLVA